MRAMLPHYDIPLVSCYMALLAVLSFFVHEATKRVSRTPKYVVFKAMDTRWSKHHRRTPRYDLPLKIAIHVVFDGFWRLGRALRARALLIVHF